MIDGIIFVILGVWVLLIGLGKARVSKNPEAGAGRTLEDITPAELERLRTERLVKIKPATVNREFALLRRVFNVAIRDGKTERNPVTKLGKAP